MDFKPIQVLFSQFEADMLTEVFTLEGIPFRIEVHEQDPLHHLRDLQEGYGRVLVRPENEAEALALIEQMRQAPQGDPEELPPGHEPL